MLLCNDAWLCVSVCAVASCGWVALQPTALYSSHSGMHGSYGVSVLLYLDCGHCLFIKATSGMCVLQRQYGQV
jgi:hypothetical protein